jgi:hypothetical protein
MLSDRKEDEILVQRCRRQKFRVAKRGENFINTYLIIVTMKTENWQIEYDMQTPKGVVHVTENLPCRAGYHQKLLEWYKQQGFNVSEVQPLYKVRGNYIELLSLGLEGGRDLPLEQRVDLKDSELLASEGHPITLISPNGAKYVHSKF